MTLLNKFLYIFSFFFSLCECWHISGIPPATPSTPSTLAVLFNSPLRFYNPFRLLTKPTHLAGYFTGISPPQNPHFVAISLARLYFFFILGSVVFTKRQKQTAQKANNVINLVAKKDKSGGGQYI